MRIWDAQSGWSKKVAFLEAEGPPETSDLMLETKQGRFLIRELPDGSLEIVGNEPANHNTHLTSLAVMPKSGNLIEVGFAVRPNAA